MSCSFHWVLLRPRRLAPPRPHSPRPPRRQVTLGQSVGRSRPQLSGARGSPRGSAGLSDPLPAPARSAPLLADAARGTPSRGGAMRPTDPAPRLSRRAPPSDLDLYVDWPPRNPARRGIGPAAALLRGGGTPGGCDSRNATPGVPDSGDFACVASPRRDRRVPPPPFCGRKERHVPFFCGISGS